MIKNVTRCPTCGREEKPKRSLSQNNYAFGVVYKILSLELGYTVDEIHDIMKYKFLPRTIKIGDESIIVPTSTTQLDTSQMEDYLRQIREWASTLEPKIFIPKPNEENYDTNPEG